MFKKTAILSFAVFFIVCTAESLIELRNALKARDAATAAYFKRVNAGIKEDEEC